MRRFKLWASAVLVLAVIVAGSWAVWNFELRWRPKTITRHQAEITNLLQSAGWVSPGLPGKKLYMVSYRNCPECIRFKLEEVPKLSAKNVDSRVIEIARRDVNGLTNSTAAERATVAQLWITRSWKLMQAWEAVPADAWTAPGIPRADGDMARTAVVESGRNLVDRLQPLLKDNGINFAYPTLIWWNDKGEMRGCACERRETYRFVRRELGA
ncbi:hypothetical protein DJ021_07660 [Phenylobacterium hankyongense]|uniref:Thioredoxin-like fold domain-containing protein n=1 Tax=Phenylobacterium hankyongense TaxID=1813876 RepID=A0A328AZG6_9CAUL|nr:hypothetical protein [Phenylobacterium hankyongense]RAK59685.1 hypothetical protein DJ021_07660 [Phenylobacterium hankyongense]